MFLLFSLATKQVGTGRIHIWDLAEHASMKKKKIRVEPLATLEYAYTDVDYLNFGFAAGTDFYILCS